MKLSSKLPYHERQRLKLMMAEMAKRECEALAIYDPTPVADQFHASVARERLLRGGNRAGKTLAGAGELARAITGRDPYEKYPKTDGVFICVGKDLKHIGRVVYNKVFRAGPFDMIRDPVTEKWRTFKPWEPWDAENKSKARKAPPLVPTRYVKSVAWDDKKEHVPSRIELVNGWVVYFASGVGKPIQGLPIDGAWLDEEIPEGEAWYEELCARILDKNGRIYWTATPQNATEQMYRLHVRAKEAAQAGDRRLVEEFTLLSMDNPYLGDQEKADFAAQMGGDEEKLRIRLEGEFAIEGHRVFPEFSPQIHGVERFDVPADWTRYVAVDPGVQVCAVAFLAVPPMPEKDHVYLYRELYIRRCNAAMFAEELYNATQPGECYEAFLIDARSARTTELSTGRTVGQQYAEELEKKKVTSRRNGSNFLWATDDLMGSIESLRAWLRVRNDGTARLKYFRDVCANFESEIRSWRYSRRSARAGGTLTDRPAQGSDHLIDCVRYLAAFDPQYVKAKKPSVMVGDVIRSFMKKQARDAKLHGSRRRGISLGPPSD